VRAIDEVVEFACAVGSSILDGEERDPADIARARTTCEELLAEPIEVDDDAIWPILVAWAALSGEDTFAQLVLDLADGGTDAECPKCYRSSELVTDGEALWLDSDDAGSGEEGVRDPSTPLPAGLVAIVARARTAGRPAIVRAIEILDSRVQCPFCDEWSAALETISSVRED
jgi:hypothetical protein